MKRGQELSGSCIISKQYNWLQEDNFGIGSKFPNWIHIWLGPIN